MRKLPPSILAAISPDEGEPRTMLDHALLWAKQGVHVFPVERFLGVPLIEKWHHEASKEAERLIEWWSRDPAADIAAAPDRSNHFVIVATGIVGSDSLAELEAEHGELPSVFRYANAWGDEHIWLEGDALTSHNRLGPGLHVLGPGNYCYVAPSLAPDHV